MFRANDDYLLLKTLGKSMKVGNLPYRSYANSLLKFTQRREQFGVQSLLRALQTFSASRRKKSLALFFM